MLQNVLDDFLGSVRLERSFDLPFLALLPAMGFYDVHFTHGQAEFGKDFIAKKTKDGITHQFSFQSKAGDINQAEWRSVQGQMLEAVTTTLSHPNFDASLPHQSVLVTTGRLVGNSAIGLQNLNEQTLKSLNKLPIEVWDRPTLAQFLASYGLEGVHRATAQGFINYGRFYNFYGKAIQSRLSDRQIEEFSNQWLHTPTDTSKRMLVATLEAELLASQCEKQGLLHEALHCYLGLHRAVLHALHDASNAQLSNTQEAQNLRDLHRQILGALQKACHDYTAAFSEEWQKPENSLATLIEGSGRALTYAVHCARFLEAISLRYLLEEDRNEQTTLTELLEKFVTSEPRCTQIIGDRYAVSLVLPVLILCGEGRNQVAQDLLRRAAVWMCDRYELGAGLARIGATAYEETTTLFGHAFDFIPIDRRKQSLLATVLCDLAAFVGDPQLYEDIVNDVGAVDISPGYWQAPDSKGQFVTYGTDVIHYPNVKYQKVFTPFEQKQFADHIANEQILPAKAEEIGFISYAALMLLLRDRYFPGLWPIAARQPDRRKHCTVPDAKVAHDC